MKDHQGNPEYLNNEKTRIRNRYKGSDQSELELIPAIEQENFYEDTSEKRVAVYARVSTDDPRQTSSYELQKNHYTDLVNQHPNWKLVDIYADEGISGTSLQHRNSFIRMINDCHDGKIDLIVTKSVARFARNVLDCISHVRQLAALNPPVGILFETESIYTLDRNSEMSLSIISTLAQEESHNKSEIMNASIEMRFKRGIFLTPTLLGYDHDEEGNLVINYDEAKTVRLIFFMYLYGYSSSQIAETLSKLKRKTKKDNTTWSSNSVIQVLQNERHCGDVLARKTWTPNYLDHKSKKNKQDRNQYRKRDHHEAIVSRDDFIAVQHLINNAKYGHKGILPKLQVIADGILKGYVSINPRWAGFKAENYFEASDSVYDDIGNIDIDDYIIEAKNGEFDLRDFETVRSQFFDTAQKIFFTISPNYFSFSTQCMRKIEKTLYIEILVHPRKKLLLIRPCKKEIKNSIRWANTGETQYYPRNINCAAYIDTLYQIFGWNREYRYKVQGLFKKNNNEKIIIFDIDDAEIFLPQAILESDVDEGLKQSILSEDINLFTSGVKKDIRVYPSTWSTTFGNNFYQHVKANEASFSKNQENWGTSKEGIPFNDNTVLNVTSESEVSNQIKEMMHCMEQEAFTNDE